MGVNEDDLTVSVPKLFFGYATGTNLLFPFSVGGATALFAERATAEKMFEVIERYRPTILTTVPTMINGMLNVEDASRP
jgi:acyl-coenzyme A synthetase/AMP-(fatty) acid ligase